MELNQAERFIVRIEFEGKLYEAMCSIVQLVAHDCRRCRIQFEHQVPQNVGIYRSDNEHQMLEDAKIIFQEILQELSDANKLSR